MTPDIALVFVVTAAAFGLFAWGRFPVDHVALAVPLVLLGLGLISEDAALSGLSSPATVTVGAMLVLGLGLDRSGAVSALGRWASAAPLGGARTRFFLLCGLASLVSPFLNNTAVVVVFIPVFMAVARRLSVSPSRHLIPLSYAAILGGTVTVVGTSTNLVVVGLAQQRGFEGLGMFSIAPLGLIYLAVGLAYLFIAGPHLLPERAPPPDVAGKYDLREFTTELEVDDRSPAVERTLETLGWGERYGVRVIGILRGPASIPAPGPRREIRAGDVLLVQGDAASLLRLEREQRLSSPARRAFPGVDLTRGEGKLIEVLLAPGCELLDRTLGEAGFRQRYDAVVLAAQSRGVIRRARLSESRFDVGDILLVHGTVAGLRRMLDEPGYVSLGEVERPVASRGRIVLASGTLLGVVVLAGTGVTSILTAGLAGVGALVLGGCLSLREIYDELEWPILFLLAGLIPLGVALDETGAAAWVAGGLASALEGASPTVVVMAFYLLTSLLTEVMSNNASAILLTPVALSAAGVLGVNPYALLVAVMFGASASFMTPIGYQTNALVMGPGGYTFRDYFRIGAPLNFLLLVTAGLLIPVMWPS